MQSKIAAVQSKVQECIKLAEVKFGITMPDVQVRFDLRGRAAGMACKRGNLYYIRINKNHLMLGGKTWEHMIDNVIPHEIAHTVCQFNPGFGRKHDGGWKRVCIALGGNGERCYSDEDAPEAIAMLQPYVYITTNGSEVRVTKVIHKKIQSGHSYAYRDGKGIINSSCQYNYMAPTAIVAAKKPKVVTTAKQSNVGGMSNAERIRARIALAKINDEKMQEVILFGMQELKMSKALATTYVKNNWNKV